VATIWRFEIEGVHVDSGHEWAMHQHYQTDLIPTQTEPPGEMVLQEIKDHYTEGGVLMSLLRNAVHNNNRLTQLRVREERAPGDSTPGEVFTQDVSLIGNLGAVTGDQLPPEMCVWLKWTTAFAGRSGRGGTHMPPQLQPSNLTTGGVWDSAILTTFPFSAFADATVDDLDDVFPSPHQGSLRPKIYSRTRRGRGQSPFTFDVTGAAFATKPRWLRRRGR
jgi:hypothetical protein